MPNIHVPKLVKAHDEYWIPPLPPNWEDYMGGYTSREEAEIDREGLERTINDVPWQMMLIEMCDDFEEEWKSRLIDPDDIIDEEED